MIKPFVFQCLSAFLPILLAAISPLLAQAEYNPIKRLSISNASIEGNNSSSTPQISMEGTGRYVVFSSEADNLISGDSNGFSDIFLFDRFNNKILKISFGAGKTQANGNSFNPSLSKNGRYIAYESDADNIVASDTNLVRDIFVYDIQGQSTLRVSLSTGKTQANSTSQNAMISGDGLFVVFESDASNLVGSDNNTASDIFLHNLSSSTTTRVSVKSNGNQATGESRNSKISENGQFIVFQSDAFDLINSDTNSVADIFLHDTNTSATIRVSISSAAAELAVESTNPNISPDASIIAFESASNTAVINDTNEVVDIFSYVKATTAVSRVSVASSKVQANAASSSPSLSTDGRYISFVSSANNLDPDDLNEVDDIFVHDRTTGDTALVSTTVLGTEVLAASSSPSINSNGQFTAFSSNADNLVNSDTNDVQDIFVINTQCRVEPVGVTPGDFDADGTDDCADDCPTDFNKTEVGECGCGTAETDTDSDGTPDCNDECPNDANKTEAGGCGCGVSDADANGNGVVDCLDPTVNTVPSRPRIRIKNSSIVRVLIGSNFTNQRAQVQLRKRRRRIAVKKTKAGRRSTQFKNIRTNGRARYRYIIPGTSPEEYSQWSSNKRYRVN